MSKSFKSLVSKGQSNHGIKKSYSGRNDELIKLVSNLRTSASQPLMLTAVKNESAISKYLDKEPSHVV